MSSDLSKLTEELKDLKRKVTSLSDDVQTLKENYKSLGSKSEAIDISNENKNELNDNLTQLEGFDLLPESIELGDAVKGYLFHLDKKLVAKITTKIEHKLKALDITFQVNIVYSDKSDEKNLWIEYKLHYDVEKIIKLWDEIRTDLNLFVNSEVVDGSTTKFIFSYVNITFEPL